MKFLGAMIGDIVGSKYEFNNIRTKKFELFGKGCYATDDTVITAAVWDAYLKCGLKDKEVIIDSMKQIGRRHPNSYGGHFGWWIKTDDRNPYYSYGNGAAMRISPVGWVADSEDEVKELSYNVTSVTHNHPEGLKGAEVTAMMIYKARTGSSMKELWDYAVSEYPQIESFDYEWLRKNYWFNETCQDTVPQAIYCFLISKDFEDCLRTTISIGGDCDTTAAISCAIAEAYYKNIPGKIEKQAVSKLPGDIKAIMEDVWKTKSN